MTHEVVVIGGGVMGCMAAYTLAMKGMKDIMLLESHRLGDAATGQSAAMLVHQTGDKLLSELAFQSIKAYRQLNQRRWDIGFNRCGSILFCTREKDVDTLAHGLQIQRDLGLKSKQLSHEQISTICPELNTNGIFGATLCPEDGYLISRALLQELRKELMRLGVTVRERQAVSFISESPAGFKILTSDGEVSTKRVVNAAGARAPTIAGWLGDTLPVSLSKRHLFVFRPPERPNSFPICENVSDEWYFRRWEDRYILVGMGTVEVQGDSDSYDFSNPERDPRSREVAFSYVASRFPEWSGILCDRFWAGVRPMTPDGRPIISASPAVKGLYHCAGLSAFGISTAPACADILAALILEEKEPVSGAFEELSLQRVWDAESGTSNRVGPEGAALIQRDDDEKREHAMRASFSSIVAKMPEEYSTPYYVYDIERVREDARLLKSALLRFELLYAYKANPVTGIINAVTELGFGADVSAIGDLQSAINAGVEPERIIFGGPGKTEEELCDAIVAAKCIVSVDSAQELVALQQAAHKGGARVPVLLRVNCAHRPQIAGEYMAGGPSQFGTDEEGLQQIVDKLNTELIDFLGIHVHVASQVLDEDAIIDHYVKTTQLALRVGEKFQLPIHIINFGGGIGVPYSAHERSPDLAKISRQAIAEIEKLLPGGGRDVRLQLELGRSISAGCGLFVTKIVDIKSSRGRNYIITESGISAFSRPAMPWAQQHRCWSYPPRNARMVQYCVTGRTCLPADVLVRSAALPEPKVGDLICIEQAGAYGFTMSLLKWSGIDAPIEVTHDGGEFALASDIQNRIAKPNTT